MHRRSLIVYAGLCGGVAWVPSWAHHGWSSFDPNRPLYLEGKAVKVAWRNPHAELDLQVTSELKLPADLAQRPFPTQSAQVDGKRVLGSAQLPRRKDKVWNIELAPLTRLEAWNLAEIKVGDTLSVVGFTFADEKGDPVLRAEYVFVGGKAYGMRSSPA